MIKQLWEMTKEEYAEEMTVTVEFSTEEELSKFILDNATDKGIYGNWFKVGEQKWFVDSLFGEWNGKQSITKFKAEYRSHPRIVLEAIQNGLSVPEQVLKQYPQLSA